MSVQSAVAVDASRSQEKSGDPTASRSAGQFTPLRICSYGFVAALLTSLFVFKAALIQLARFSHHSEYSYISFVPLISAFLISVRRESIFENAEPSVWIGSCTVAGGMLLWFGKEYFPIGSIANLDLSALAVVGTWVGLFVLCYGAHAARMALMPLLLLLFAIPPPESVLNTVIQFLQEGSTVVSCHLFRMVGIPVLREGTIIVLPQLALQVAPECSGIRSSISLLILALVIGDLYLRSGWNKALLVLIIVPLSVAKNAIRIVTLSTLAMYVDPEFLDGPLHHRGGIVFFVLAVMILVVIVMAMRWVERIRSAVPATESTGYERS